MSSPCNHAVRAAIFGAFTLISLVLPQLAAAESDDLPCCGGQTFIPYAPAPDDPDAPQKAQRLLRISADPNNLPFTNDRLEGFENRIAEVIARELQADVLYIWRAQRRGFFRAALKENECDLVLGVPSPFDLALTTQPYYTSAYCFVSRKDRGHEWHALDDPLLREARVGVSLIGDDGYNSPPAHALAMRGMVDNIIGFTVYGDYEEPNPPARIVEAVAAREVDVAVVWGPLAGYFARQSPVELVVTPVTPALDRSGLPFAFSIAMGVRRGEAALRDEINAILESRKSEIDAILDAYGVPRVEPIPFKWEDDDD